MARCIWGGVRERKTSEAIQKPNRAMRLKSLKADADALGRKGNSAAWVLPIGKLSIVERNSQ